ncbi:MAG: hypothetical protein AAGA28_01960 [Pseudomonadota bacterium]
MIALAALACVPTAAAAWDFTPGLPCRLVHQTADAKIGLTYDPVLPVYTVTVTRSAPWPNAGYFGMRFDGPQGRRIGTDRHRLSANGRALSVADVGFGNVLDGLQYNRSVTATSGGAAVTFSLDGAAGPVAEFRACAAGAPSS